MNFNERVSMRDIAKVAGVHQSTVSLALRNHRSIPEETRQRILKISKDLGYRPHPFLSMLSSVRKSRRSKDYGAVLSYVLYGDTHRDVRNEHFEGARKAAEEQGFQLEKFIVGKIGLTPRRLNEILLARNIQGVVIGPMPEAHSSFELSWEQFCTVVIEYTFRSPVFDTVVHDNFLSMKCIMQKCRERKLSRVGLTLLTDGDARTEGLISASYWRELKTRGFFASIPPLYQDQWNEADTKKWLNKYRPQVVVTSALLLGYLFEYFKKNKRRIPSDISLVNIHLTDKGWISGIDQNHGVIGETAVHLLIDKINRNDRGVPAYRKLILTPGEWHEGETLREKELNRRPNPAKRGGVRSDETTK